MRIYRAAYWIVDHTTGQKTEEGYHYSGSPLTPSASLLDANRTRYVADSDSSVSHPESEPNSLPLDMQDFSEFTPPDGYTLCSDSSGSYLRCGNGLQADTAPRITAEQAYDRGLKNPRREEWLAMCAV
jgi:hypothetical protein